MPTRLISLLLAMMLVPMGCGSEELGVVERVPADAASQPVGGPGLGTVAALPWPERVEFEQRLAQKDPRHAPSVVDGRPTLWASGRLGARFGEDGAHVRLPDGREIGLRLSRLGRWGTTRATEAESTTVTGPHVEIRRGTGLVEWWRSLPSGLEQGVTLTSRPPGSGPLVIEVAVDGSVYAEAELDSDSVALRALSDDRVLAHYGHLWVLDGEGAQVPAHFEVRAPNVIALVVDDRQASYPLVVDPLVWTEEALLVGSGTASGDAFGSAVALNADGSYALIGAARDDSNAGSVRVFVRLGNTWTEEAVLLAPDRRTGDLFGSAVALSADGSRAVVGAPFDDTPSGLVDAGSVRVFVRSGSTWTEEAALPGRSAGDTLGASVALSADGSRALAGAPHDDTVRGSDAGSAQVFVRSGSSWTSDAILVASEGMSAGHFGDSVALSGDGSRALIGAPDDSSVARSAGRAWVFVDSVGTWTEEAMLLASGGAALDAFGGTGALTADGSRALVGASGDDTADGADAGSVRVFVRSGSSWTEEVPLLAAGGADGDGFGSVALSADGSRAVIGATGDDTAAGVDAGSARVFARSGGGWIEETTLVSSRTSAGDLFGFPALSADGSRALIVSSIGRGYGQVFALTECATGTDCASGFCVDGVCCDAACGGGARDDCQACLAALTGGADGTCAPIIASVVCRSAAGPCDAAESCSGTSTACPSDTFLSAGTVCRAAVADCDVAEVCGGSGVSCPSDSIARAGTLCRAAAGACDIAEGCNGLSNACPTDRVLAAGTECRAPAGLCDAAEVCDGSALCPADAFAPTGTACSGGSCNGLGACTSGCVPASPCARGSACERGVVDCTTGAPVCVSAGPAPAGTLCRAVAGTCDVPESCDGTSTACPADGHVAAGTECRAAAETCDLPESCTGISPVCPADVQAPAGTVCRAATGPCDVAESCDGAAAGCPIDVPAPDGADCSDPDPCNGAEQCASGVCVAGTPPASCCRSSGDCDDANPCTTDVCRPAEGVCDHAPVAGCCRSDADCATNEQCLANVCVVGAEPGPDGGAEPSPRRPGCGCGVAGAAGTLGWRSLGVALLPAIFVARRRRIRK